MRITSTASDHTPHVAINAAITVALIGFCLALPQAVAAATVLSPSDGCFFRTSTTIRLTEPTCTMSADNDAASFETVSLQFENLDPDGYEISGAEYIITDREKNAWSVELTIEPGDTTLTVSPWFATGDDAYFVALSDNQGRGTVETNPIFEDVFSQVAVINPLFFTNAGDLVQGSDSATTMAEMFAAVQETIAGASVPMYPVPGNHDYDDNLTTYRTYFGETNYSYDFGPLHLMALSTSGDDSRGTVTADQLSWIESEFATTQPYTMIYFHHPLSAPAWGKPTCCFAETERDQLADLLDAQRVDLVVNGHSQGYDYRYLQTPDVSTIELGMYQLISGGAGGNIAQPGGDYHFTLMHVSPSGIEHYVVTEDNFGLALQYTNNRGQSERATAVIENNSALDIPYVRLKFRLASTATSFLIQDETGAYYHDYQSHAYDEYTVVYVTMALPANTTHTFTAEPAMVIHTDTTQTIDTSGIVTYDIPPTTTATALSLTALPATGITTLSDVYTETDIVGWVESPAIATAATTYTLTGLENNAYVNIAVDSQLVERLLANDRGELEFTYAQDNASRSFRVHILPEPANTIATLPSRYGASQVRIFSQLGMVQGQWYAFDQTTIGEYQLWRGDILNTAADEIMVYQPAGVGKNVRIYTLEGEELAALRSPTLPFIGDVSGDGQADIVAWSSQQRKLRMHTYLAATNTVIVKRYRFERSEFGSRSSIVAVTDVTNDDRADIVMFDETHRRLSLLEFNGTEWTMTRSYILPYRGTIQSIAPGYFQSRDALSLVVLYTRPSGKQYLWQFKSRGQDRWVRSAGPSLTNHTIAALTTASLQTDQSDAVVALTTTGLLNSYQLVGRTWQVISSTSLEVEDHEDWQIGTVNGGATVPERIVVSELAAPGRVTVWQYSEAQTALVEIAQWYGYGATFPGGTIIASNLFLR